MSDIVIFFIGLFVTALCAAFLVITFVELKRVGNVQEHR
jgi:hypothetical protein